MTIIIEGEPVAQGRPRFTRQGHAYDPAKSREYKRLIALKAQAAMRGKEIFTKPRPLCCKIRIFRRIPKSFAGRKLFEAKNNLQRPVTRPDADNYVKGILDAMNGIVYEDDALICRLVVEKFYTDKQPRIVVIVEEIQ